MSFFNLSTGEQANQSGSMEMGGDIEPIPAKTQVKAAIEEASWYTPKDGGDTVIRLNWSILGPKEYANRKVSQNLKVRDSDSKKRDKAIMMLGAIDKNAGGKLFASGQEPTDDTLMMCLLNKPMVLLLQVYIFKDDMTGEVIKTGNWVGAVSPMSGQAAKAAKAVPVKPAPATFDEEDIPF